ncbi:GroES-like protein [Trichoderma chlorosporum]
MAALPTSMRALVVKGPGDGAVENIPVPQPGPGSIIVRVLDVLAYKITPDFFSGAKADVGMTLPYPLVFGGAAVGRVAAIGPDSTAFSKGQLVLIEPHLRARDDPNVAVVWGGYDGFDPRTKQFVKDNWRDGCWAEYVRTPLENTWALREDTLVGKLGLKTQDLLHLGYLSVLYAGLRRIDSKAGETILICPATGVFSNGAIAIAQALGLNVIAGGRNSESLDKLKLRFPGIQTIQLHSTPEDTVTLQDLGPVDAFVDIGPAAATGASYPGACILSVRKGGRVCLIGGRADATLPVPYQFIMFNNITLRGSLKYDPEHVRELIQLAESDKDKGKDDAKDNAKDAKDSDKDEVVVVIIFGFVFIFSFINGFISPVCSTVF